MGISGPIRKRKAIFLDRDGVINQPVLKANKPYPPENLSQVILIHDVVDSLKELCKNNYLIFVVTNQPDVARGLTDKEKVEEIHEFMKKTLPVTEIFVCYHDDDDQCDCRKPKPGLLFQAEKYGIDYQSSFMIGDRWRDIGAGLAAGCHTILIDYNYSENDHGYIAEKNVSNLTEAVNWILNYGD